MKIRHKQSGVELEGEFDRVHMHEPSRSFAQPAPIEVAFYSAKGSDYSRYDCRDWEAVPEWVDVTGACTVHEDGAISHGNIMRFVPHAATYSYRLRKVRFSTGIPPFSGERWAFIVERKA